ncbi:MAG: HAMP domain-containing histidine kinase [Desulfobacterales bacterium]|nr:HAMP domain-containing histidine kinase [Desulfobacterales bacterium]
MEYNGIIGKSGLQFFGKISASISHEIKNALAIINENAGLLEDFVLMAEQGLPLDPERIKTLSSKIMKQIQRADTIIKNMNQFAHSIDADEKNIDINMILELIIALSARAASMKGVTLVFLPASRSLSIETNPFFLLNLMHSLIITSLDHLGGNKQLTISSRSFLDCGCIELCGIERLESESLLNHPERTAIASLIQANVVANIQNHKIEIYLPCKPA